MADENEREKKDEQNGPSAINCPTHTATTGAIVSGSLSAATSDKITGATSTARILDTGTKAIKTEIDKYTISAKFRDWALRILQEEHSGEAAEREAIYNSQLTALETAQKELDTLITMRMRDLINDEQYASPADLG